MTITPHCIEPSPGSGVTGASRILSPSENPLPDVVLDAALAGTPGLILIGGATMSGKSFAMGTLVYALLDAGKRAIVLDEGDEFLVPMRLAAGVHAQRRPMDDPSGDALRALLADNTKVPVVVTRVLSGAHAGVLIEAARERLVVAGVLADRATDAVFRFIEMASSASSRYDFASRVSEDLRVAVALARIAPHARRSTIIETLAPTAAHRAMIAARDRAALFAAGLAGDEGCDFREREVAELLLSGAIPLSDGVQLCDASALARMLTSPPTPCAAA